MLQEIAGNITYNLNYINFDINYNLQHYKIRTFHVATI